MREFLIVYVAVITVVGVGIATFCRRRKVATNVLGLGILAIIAIQLVGQS